jgi:mono/diheme cytochrome c family protein
MMTSRQFMRGAYLVEGLGHCGACHTPRNVLGAEKAGQAYSGGTSEGWPAPALNLNSPAALPWTADRLYSYLQYGSEGVHGTAAGPMATVVTTLAAVPEEDVRAIATYVAAVAGSPSESRLSEANKVLSLAKGEDRSAAAAAAPENGATIYVGACAQCHGEAGRAPAVAGLNLSFSSALRMPRPDNVVRIVWDGIHPLDGEPDR